MISTNVRCSSASGSNVPCSRMRAAVRCLFSCSTIHPGVMVSVLWP